MTSANKDPDPGGIRRTAVVMYHAALGDLADRGGTHPFEGESANGVLDIVEYPNGVHLVGGEPASGNLCIHAFVGGSHPAAGEGVNETPADPVGRGGPLVDVQLV